MQPLPVDEILPELVRELKEHDSVVLEAPPGAGKTTRVPLALLESGLAVNGKILMLEPRRLAARAAAEHMASLLSEKAGQTVGYRIRSESKVSSSTRIEVITEGVLTRMLQTDPALDGVSVVIFDEFHERSIDADLGLSLSLAGRELFRAADAPLKIIVMSATLDGSRVAGMLDDAPVVSSSGRTWPVDIRHVPAPGRGERIEPAVTRAVIDAANDESGSVLVFLPGQREIHDVERRLLAHYADSVNAAPEIRPLYGNMKFTEQREAIRPAAEGARKIVLATDIAESSLTIEGVRVVVDSGLSRVARFDPRTGMTRLATERVSASSATQRAGRAGRIEPGVCIRLWSVEQQRSLLPHMPAEITQADLAPLLLALLRFGVADANELRWLDPPPAAALAQAEDLLIALGAVERTDDTLILTAHGEAMSRLPAHPRLAHMLVTAANFDLIEPAARVAAVLSGRDPSRDAGADLTRRLELFDSSGANRGPMRDAKLLYSQFTRMCDGLKTTKNQQPPPADQVPGFLTALAYPERIAQRRSGGDSWRLANGRSARVREGDSLSNCDWLAVAHTGGSTGQAVDQIMLACRFDPTLFESELSKMIHTADVVEWSPRDNSLTAECQRKVGELVLDAEPIDDLSNEMRVDAVAAHVKKEGLAVLPFDNKAAELRNRVEFLRQLDAEKGASSRWPDWSDTALIETLDNWLRPWLTEIRHANHFAKLDIAKILLASLEWPMPRELDELAPLRYKVPSGSMIKLDYSEHPPTLAVKLQEIFGCTMHPAIANGTALKVALLSPAGRPVQVTQDIGGFWTGSYTEVKKEMKGRYPKHYWPDDPAIAEPSVRTTKKSRQ